MKKLNFTKLTPYFYVAPFFILFAVFGVFPLFYSIVLSFFKWTPSGPEKFVGFANYIRYFTKDPYFGRSVYNTILLLFTGSYVQHLFALPLAIMLNQKFIKGRDALKTIYFIPNITSTVVVTIIFSMLFDEKFGFVNYILENWFGLPEIHWLSSSPGIKATVSFILNWKYIGFYTILYLAGLQAIPQELYESAHMDGANVWQQHFKITLPLLLPVVFFALSISTINGLQLFDEPFILTGQYSRMGGVDNGGLTTTFYLMFLGFRLGRFGRASAVAWLQFFIILAFTFVLRAIINRFDYTIEKKKK